LAIAAGGDDATVLAISGFVIGFLEPREYEIAVSSFDRSLALSNSSALALRFSAATRAWHGESAIAIEQAEQALRLSPFDSLSNLSYMAIAIAHFVAGRFEEAAAAASKAVQANPRFSPPYWMRAAALASLGRIDDAEAVAQLLLKVQPQFTIGSITSAPFANREILDALGNALRRVGMRATWRLAAILAADVARYSRLMGADEEGALESLKALLRELLDLKIAEHHGRRHAGRILPASSMRCAAVSGQYSEQQSKYATISFLLAGAPLSSLRPSAGCNRTIAAKGA
jgi:tetratricopeptide (TPR) repeat protein